MKLDAIIRVSKVGYRDTSLQSDAEQLRAIRAYCDANGIELGQVHVEKDVSGKTTNRKALKAAKARALEGETDGIIAAYLSRFSRNTKEGLELVSDLLDNGRHFVALDMAGIDLSSGTGEQMLTMMLGQARAEWRARKDNFDHYRVKAVKSGKHLTERFGYRLGPDGLVRDEAEAPYVPMIFERRAGRVVAPDGRSRSWSWTELADWLNDLGVKPHVFSDRKDGQPTKRKAGKRWTHGGVKALVESRTYLGEAKSGETVTVDAHEALVSLELFAACEALRDLRKRRGAKDFVLSGIAVCECGARIKGQTQTKPNGAEYLYYWCAGKCTRKAPAGKLEAFVFDIFAETARGLRAYAVERTGTIDAALAHVRDMEELERQAGADLELMQASRPAYLAAVAEAAQRVRTARGRLAVERSRITGVSATDDDLENWDSLSPDTRRRFLAEAFDAIVVSTDRRDAAPIGRGELADAESFVGRFLTFAE
jgi:DNA invertase Pin-like site-specific DNA recombinase